MAAEPAVTFARDVAPILYENCVPCHRPGGAGPFPLVTYEDAKSRARQIADVTATRFMPPWLPEPGYGRFEGERRLSDGEIGTLARWAEAGAPAGELAELPPVPEWPEGWQLGDPDLVLETPPFELSASGPDVFRNFVLPTDLPGVRYVRGVELMPENPAVVHHAVMQVDRTGSVQRLDDEAPGPGFGGMLMGASERPDGHFVGWTPGHLPREVPRGLAWRLHPGSDVVVQLHMPPSGKPETVRVKVGLHFTPEPPTRELFGLLLGSEQIDIPPGERDYELHDRFSLPVAVEALGIYPHAHYLAERMEAWAELPGGERRWLLKIADWDFDWQDEYRYAEPVPLPAGSEVVMRYTYDNSPANPQNPHHPPRRVQFGPESTDEMAFLLLSVLPERPGDLPALQRAQLERTVEKRPSEWRAWLSLGDVQASQEDLAAAVASFRRAASLEPREAVVFQRLGRTLGKTGDLAAAIEQLERAAELAPAASGPRNDLGVAHQARGDLGQAERWFRAALALEPESPEANVNLARLLAVRGEAGEARRHLERALAALPADGELAARIRGWLSELPQTKK